MKDDKNLKDLKGDIYQEPPPAPDISGSKTSQPKTTTYQSKPAQESSYSSPFVSQPPTPIQKNKTPISQEVQTPTPPPPQEEIPIPNPTSSQTTLSQSTFSQTTSPQMPPVQSSPLSTQTGGFVSRPPKKFPFFKVFVIISILAIIVIYSIVGYLYFKNRQLTSTANVEIITNQVSKSSEKEANKETQTTPTPAFSPSQIKIVNGSVVREIPQGETKVLVRKEDFPSTGIIGFARVVVSPDNQKMCLESLPPATKPALYIANIDGTSTQEISKGKQNCLWANDSQKIFYTDTLIANSSVDIYLYELSLNKEENLTATSSAGIKRAFKIVGLSADETKLICQYQDYGESQKSGNCEVNLETKEITLL